MSGAERRMTMHHVHKLKKDYGVNAKEYGEFVRIEHDGLTHMAVPPVIGYGPERALTKEESFSEFFQSIPIEMRRSMSKGSVIVDDPLME